MPAGRCVTGSESAVADSPFVEDDRLSDGSSILRVTPGGACSCYDPDGHRCRIHAQLARDALPVACQHFPRVCVVDRDATSVTLSHYCPTAARLLFEPLPIAIVEAPAAFAPMQLEGLDARDALPPLLRPGMLADRESYRSWERLALEALSEETTGEAALAAIVDATEGIRGWEPARGPLVETVSRAFTIARERPREAGPAGLLPAASSLDALVRRCVPEGLSAPPAPDSASRIDERLVAPNWRTFAGPVRRYLAAKAFADWCAYQGRGLRTVACSIAAALSVLRVEAVRHCAEADRMLDEALLIEAFRSADLLLVHLASREELARRFSAVEEARAEEMVEGWSRTS